VTAVVAVMRWLARVPGCTGARLDVSGFSGTSIELPADELSYTNAFTGDEVPRSPGTQVLVSDMFAGLPVALWTGVSR